MVATIRVFDIDCDLRLLLKLSDHFLKGLLSVHVPKLVIDWLRRSEADITSQVRKVFFMAVELEACWLYKCVFVLRARQLILLRLGFLERAVFGLLAVPLYCGLYVIGEDFKYLESVIEGGSEGGFLNGSELAESVDCIF